MRYHKLDKLLSGGIENGTITLLSGPSGVGKSTMGMQFMKTGAVKRCRSVVFSFEEEFDLIVHHFEAINIPVRNLIEQGYLSIQKIEAFKFSPDEFSSLIREEVEEKKTQLILIDSLSGFNAAIDQYKLVENLHTVGRYLKNMNVALFIVTDTSNIIESLQVSDIGISYFVDNIIFFAFCRG